VFYGCNYNRTRFAKKTYHSLHAEINTLLKYIKSFNYKNKVNGTMYVVRILKNNKNIPIGQTITFGNSKPCSQCSDVMEHYGIKKIKYTDYINDTNVLCEMKLVGRSRKKINNILYKYRKNSINNIISGYCANGKDK
jgi:deoxycytidylate deaminase